jgi:hypothetical protein
MSIADDYRQRAFEAEGLSEQLGARAGAPWAALARSWRELADRLERNDIREASVHWLRPPHP